MLTKEEKRVMCQCLFDVKVPNGYSYNIRALVDMKGLKSMGLKSMGLKSHDCHKLIKYLLPIAICSILLKMFHKLLQACACLLTHYVAR